MIIEAIISTVVGAAISGVVGNRADSIAMDTMNRIVDNFDKNKRLINHDLQKAVLRSYYLAIKSICEECLDKEKGNKRVAPWFECEIEEIEGIIKQIEKNEYRFLPIEEIDKIKLLITTEESALKEIEEERKKLIFYALDKDCPPRCYSEIVKNTLYQRVCGFFAYEIKHNQIISNIFQSQLLSNIDTKINTLIENDLNFITKLDELILSSRNEKINIKYKSNLNNFENEFFIGRENVLDTISEHIKTDIIVLNGFGGVGKSQIAFKYIKDNWDLYEYIWWIDSEMPYYISKAYRDFAIMQGCATESIQDEALIKVLVKNWLSENSNWLFVFDNVESINSIKEYFPPKVNGQILITTRDGTWNGLGFVITISEFNEIESRDFLHKRLDTENEDGFSELLSELGNLPLALEQAAAYICSDGVNVEEYIELFNRNKLKMFDCDDTKPINYNETITSTWQISMNKISSLAAKQLLNMCAFYSPEDIRIEMFQNASEYLPNDLMIIIHNELEVRKILRCLKKYSLINENDGVISVHRLLQEVIIYNINDNKECLKYCSNIILHMFSFDKKEVSIWNNISYLVPHAISIAEKLEQIDYNLENAIKLYNGVGSFYRNYKGSYLEAEKILIKVLEISENFWGYDHNSVGDALNSLGIIDYYLGKYDAAERFYQRARDIYEKNHVNDNLKGSVISNLAFIFNAKGNYPRAETYFSEAIKIKENESGTNHLHLCHSLNGLADCYYNQGKYNESVSIEKRILKIREENLGNKHLDTIETRANLAEAYCHLELIEEAEALLLQCISELEDVLYKDHPNIASCLNNLAGLYLKQGKREEAEPLYIRALKIREKVLGMNHLSTAISMSNLAALYKGQKRYEEALPLYECAYDIRRSILGKEHPKTIMSFDNLTLILKKQSEYCKNQNIYSVGESLLRRVYGLEKEFLGEKDETTLSTGYELGRILMQQEKYEDGEKILREAYEGRKVILGISEASTLNTGHSLGWNLTAQKKYVDGEIILREVFERRKETLGENAKFTLISAHVLGRNLNEQMKYVEGDCILNKVLQSRIVIFGEYDENTLRTKYEIGRSLVAQQKYEEGEIVLVGVYNIQKDVLGLMNKNTIDSKKILCEVYKHIGKIAEANQLCRESQSNCCRDGLFS